MHFMQLLFPKALTLYIIGYNNISWRPHYFPRPLHPKIWGRNPTNPKDWRLCKD